jgi:hypothetical protein
MEPTGRERQDMVRFLATAADGRKVVFLFVTDMLAGRIGRGEEAVASLGFPGCRGYAVLSSVPSLRHAATLGYLTLIRRSDGGHRITFPIEAGLAEADLSETMILSGFAATEGTEDREPAVLLTGDWEGMASLPGLDPELSGDCWVRVGMEQTDWAGKEGCDFDIVVVRAEDEGAARRIMRDIADVPPGKMRIVPGSVEDN